MSEAVHVAMWSGPRNISTAMMRAFENRPDTVVVDEPLYAAREAFVTGTFAGIVPVRSVDGRAIGGGGRGPVVERLQALYRELVDCDVAARASA